MRRSTIGHAPPVAVAALLAVAGLLAACGPGATPSPAPAATASPPTASPPASLPAVSPGPSGVASAPYDITIPVPWQQFDLADPAAKAGLDAFAEANPSLAASIQGFEAIPGVRMAINPLLGDILLIITSPSNGIPLEALAPSFTAQFRTVPGVQGTPAPQDVSLPGGHAVHWNLTLTSNKPGGGTATAEESVYLFVNSTDAVIIEFVTSAGGTIQGEASIVGSFRFKS